MMVNIQERKCAGFGLVELLVAMAIGLFLVGGVISLYVTSSADRRVTEGLSRIQESGRFANEFLSRDIRMAGFSACLNARVANVLETVTGADAYAYDFSKMVYGYEGGVSSFPTSITANADTDAIVIKRGDDSGNYFVKDHTPANAASLQLVEDHDLKKGEILMIADCNRGQIGIFQQSNANLTNSVSVIDHNSGVGTPGNCTKALWGNGTCADTPSPFTYVSYESNARIMRMISNAYYIDDNAAGVPSLFRKGLSNTGAVGAAEELVEGVEDMQIEYGVDTDTPQDGVANQYVKASVVTNTQWNDGRVASVRLRLLLRSVEESATTPQQYSFNGKVFDGVANALPTDRFMRREFSATVKIRNIGL